MKTPASILNYHCHSLKWIKFLTERRILLYHKHVFGYTLIFFLKSIYKLMYRNSQKISIVPIDSFFRICKELMLKLIVYFIFYENKIRFMANIFQLGHTKMSSKNQAGKPIVLFCTGSRFNGFELHRIGSRLF